MMGKLSEIKHLLANAIGEDVTDFNKILELANDLAAQDTSNIRFSVDASHIYRLGIELVSKQETAVAELIKNAYDADASVVDLIFKNVSTKGGTLEIIDNGHGMSRDQVVNGFMRISTQDKVLSPVSLKYERQKAGRKGIGRFATQRLGERLVVSTQLESAPNSLELEIDWSSFEGGKDLYLVSNQIKNCPAKPTSGTSLHITYLRDAWSETQIQRAYRYVSDLLQPFPLNSQPHRDKKDDPGFRVTFYREQAGDLVPLASNEQNIYAHSYAQFSGEVRDDGEGYISIISNKHNIDIKNQPLGFEQRLKPKTGHELPLYSHLNGVRFTAYYFIQDELPTGTRTMVREILSRQGGVRVYRNGFRVLPYGESFDDWLGLQRSSALREILPPHHNQNFLGFVEISDVTGERFEETASREGLLENEAFLQLKDFVYRSLLAGVMMLARERGKKVFASGDHRGEDKVPGKASISPRDRAAKIAEKLRAVAAGGQVGSFLQNLPPISNLEVIASEVEKIGEESQEIIEENGMLRVLASLGLTIGEFTHEVRHALAALRSAIVMFEDEGVTENSLLAAKDNMFLLQSYVKYFDNAITQNSHRRLEAYELRDLVDEFSSVVEPTLKRQSIELNKKFLGYDLFAKPMHKSEWSSILLNLFTNSLKAIHRAGVKGKINIIGGRDDENIFLEFSDNGDGIPPANSEKIFDAFFSTSLPSGALSSHSEKLVGTGLGLKIVRDIVDAVNGEIFLTKPQLGFSTCFRIEIPRANDEEIGDSKY